MENILMLCGFWIIFSRLFLWSLVILASTYVILEGWEEYYDCIRYTYHYRLLILLSLFFSMLKQINSFIFPSSNINLCWNCLLYFEKYFAILKKHVGIHESTVNIKHTPSFIHKSLYTIRVQSEVVKPGYLGLNPISANYWLLPWLSHLSFVHFSCLAIQWKL